MPRAPLKKTAPARASACDKREDQSGTATGAALGRTSPRTLVTRKPRKPKPENTIAPSALRPHVFADERLAFWTTPYASDERRGAAAWLPDKQLQVLFLTILEAIEPDTRKNYGAGLLRFHQFCDSYDVAEQLRMPAPEVLLAAFIASWAGKVARTTIDNWLAGLSFWHTLHHAPWHGGRLLRATCSGASKLQPPPKPKRPPVTLEHMHALRSGLDLTVAFDAAVFALACSAFWGCRR